MPHSATNTPLYCRDHSAVEIYSSKSLGLSNYKALELTTPIWGLVGEMAMLQQLTNSSRKAVVPPILEGRSAPRPCTPVISTISQTTGYDSHHHKENPRVEEVANGSHRSRLRFPPLANCYPASHLRTLLCSRRQKFRRGLLIQSVRIYRPELERRFRYPGRH
jgi:hypothetical protein